MADLNPLSMFLGFVIGCSFMGVGWCVCDILDTRRKNAKELHHGN